METSQTLSSEQQLTRDSGPEGHSVPPILRSLPEHALGLGQAGQGNRGWNLGPRQGMAKQNKTKISARQ